MVRTINAIRVRAKILKSEFIRQMDAGEVSENMGNKYITKLDDFIGDVYNNYSYGERMRIRVIEIDLFNFVI